MLNRLDRAIAYLAPKTAAERARARMQLKAMELARAYYDGADIGRRGASIRRSAASSETVTARTLPRLRAGSHDLVRNNPHAHRGVQAIVSNCFGHGIMPRFKRGGETVTELEDLAKRTLLTTAIDTNGQQNLFGLQSAMGRTTVESGEALLVREFVSDGFPVRIKVLEPDHLDSSRDATRLRDGGRIIQGVEYDPQGRRRQYWLYPRHPGGSLATATSVPVPARNVAQVYRIDRPGQVHGIPWLAPIMLRLADFADYEEAQLVRQKIAACFAVFKTDAVQAMPGQEDDNDDLEKLEPGGVYSVKTGSQIEFGRPPQVTDYKDYAKTSLRSIAAGLGVSYEALTGDLEGVNFTSGRMGRLEFQRNIDCWRWLTFIPMGCGPMVDWWLEGAALLGHDVSDVAVWHRPPPTEMISPEREVPANNAAVRSGQKTLADVISRDLDDHLAEIAETNQKLDDSGIVLDSDPRRTSNAGLTQARTGESLTLPPTGPIEDDDDE